MTINQSPQACLLRSITKLIRLFFLNITIYVSELHLVRFSNTPWKCSRAQNYSATRGSTRSMLVLPSVIPFAPVFISITSVAQFICTTLLAHLVSYLLHLSRSTRQWQVEKRFRKMTCECGSRTICKIARFSWFVTVANSSFCIVYERISTEQ